MCHSDDIKGIGNIFVQKCLKNCIDTFKYIQAFFLYFKNGWSLDGN